MKDIPLDLIPAAQQTLAWRILLNYCRELEGRVERLEKTKAEIAVIPRGYPDGKGED